MNFYREDRIVKKILAASVLSADFSVLGKEVLEAVDAGAEYVHIDVMDGRFVPEISFGIPVIKSLRPLTDAVFDVHLMVDEPGRYIEKFAAAGADIISIHAEACVHPDRVIQQIRACEKRAAMALNPATSLEAVRYLLPELDMVLLMTVNPGYGGQQYISYCSRKIRALRRMAEAENLPVRIEVDGGVNPLNIGSIAECGADTFVAGSSVFEGNISENVKKLKQNM